MTQQFRLKILLTPMLREVFHVANHRCIATYNRIIGKLIDGPAFPVVLVASFVFGRQRPLAFG